jgi:hypothetical protein
MLRSQNNLTIMDLVINYIQGDPWGIPAWSRKLLISSFVFLVTYETLITIILLIALHLLNKFITQSKISETGKLNNKIVAVHISVNLLEYLSVIAVNCNDLNMVTEQTCDNMLNSRYKFHLVSITLRFTNFASQCLVYLICYNYAIQSVRI